MTDHDNKDAPRGAAVCSYNTICRDRASAVAEQQDGPKTHNNRNQNGGRENPSPTTKKPKPCGAAVCSHNTPVGVVRPLLQSNRATRWNAKLYFFIVGAIHESPAFRCEIYFYIVGWGLAPAVFAVQISSTSSASHKFGTFPTGEGFGVVRTHPRAARFSLFLCVRGGVSPPAVLVAVIVCFSDSPVALQQRTHGP